MYEITVEDNFAAAHRLREYDGNCEHIHGHNWRVKISFFTETLNSLGLAIDFRAARKILRHALDTLDHTNLNDLPAFETENPSCELIAALIYKDCAACLAAENNFRDVRVGNVIVWESPGASVTYHPGSDS